MSQGRLFKILYYLLEKGQATAPGLAAEFEVSTRTIYRDVEALSGAGIPIYTEAGRNGGIHLLDHFVLDRAVLSETEKEEILTALQSMQIAGGAPEQAETLTKLSALFDLTAADWLEIDFSRWGKQTGDHAKFELLKKAVLHHKTIRLLYAGSTGKRNARKVQPLKISYRSKEWYLKAFCVERQDFRLFKLNRILDLEILEETFLPVPYPETETAPQKYPKVVLRFSKEAAYRVYDEFDINEIEYRENGDLIASAEMPVDAWLTGYLLSFGTQVEIVEPVYLRKILAEQARKIYEKNKS